ncbi:hypothetical protein A2856_01570 [Candidatus Uhrbacteria bacterium RIFCSPHIGHO2_01_FULL_63_20]|uniref:Uncharacterized protein n=1 Tax=Candidatus Uhrbacteria bacterium RIFCSPHIGHO2_01_FULL_63_20 TaxID=1802385 RepID=A0A1F7TLD1_9BACT|nr:MAG: hypothetical protein A2856_01570 [Candidatus Uhrbacteria bacterium RIFCSPHIGHO2_01_FULL_63_20]
MNRLPALIALVAVALGALGAWTNRALPTPALGVTFSPEHAWNLGEDPDRLFASVVEDLGVKRVRLPVYWSRVEPSEGNRDFSLYDRLVRRAEEHGVELTLVVGEKVPRWPECFVPDWAEGLGADRYREELFSFVRETVERYRGSPAVGRWQVENEPFFPFGVCPKPDVRRILDEVALVRSLDDREIQLTVSGEIEPWEALALEADVLGISMYRTTWNDFFGYVRYPIPPLFYAVRAWLASPLVSRVVVSELQAEPWFFAPVGSRPLFRWAEAFTPQDLRESVDFASQTGLPEASLWGVEWWYHLKRNGYPELWEEAGKLFEKSP